MECCCYLRHVQDLLPDGKNPYDRRFGESFKNILCSPREFWEEDIVNSKKMDASEICPRRLDAKEVLITHKDGEIVFPVADGSATLFGRDYDFQEPTLRQESIVKRENLIGESHGDRKEFRPEETKDDAETQEDFRSIQGDFVYRHHIEPTKRKIIPCSTEIHLMSSGQLTPIWT